MTEFSEQDRDAICETFERLLADEAHEEILRKVIKTDTGFDQGLWQKMAELGLTGLMVGSEYGGIGAGIQEAEAVMEVAGKYLYSGPYISSCVIAPSLLSASINVTALAPHLNKISSGQSIFAVAGCGPSGKWSQGADVKAAKNDDYWELSGTAHFVVHAAAASHCLVYANAGGEAGVFLVDMNSARVLVKELSTNDKTVRLSNITFDEALAIKLDGVGQEEINNALKLALVALAGEQAGASRHVFDVTIEYLKTRFQFGQPIGRFQALKHMAADLLIEVESASSVARHAGRALAAKSEDAAMLTYLAAFTCADNFRTVASDAIQLHGGIAYTMEHSAHLYWRRAQTGQWLYGSSDQFRDSYLTEMEARL